MKQFENTLPYIYVREIPNKPPPPYVPPAHGSPMTTIFPSEQRIKDITFRRSKELFYEIFETETPTKDKLPSILEENITNIYERIILDICKEKIDNVDEIIIQELYEEEHKWTNFDEEEAEIKSIIIDEILNDVIKDVVKDECLENGVHFDEDLNNSKETSVDE
uniref:DUF4378 domain-containing protein n=1 Tax=Megaselia scalaris TaxID=36166 RepID=T1H471_MEGSC